jgi:hypothetical protein
MLLIFKKPSPGSREAFKTGLQHLVQLGRVPAGLHVHMNPQPIYVLSLKDGVSASLMPSARLVGWRYYAGDVSGEVVAGDVSATAPPAITSLRYGDSARTALTATLALRKLPDVQANNFEARLLRIPGALVEGLWLKPASDSNGLIVPLRRTFRRDKQDGRPEGIDDFLNTLRPVSESIPPKAEHGLPRKDSVQRARTARA